MVCYSLGVGGLQAQIGTRVLQIGTEPYPGSYCAFLSIRNATHILEVCFKLNKDDPHCAMRVTVDGVSGNWTGIL